MAEKNSYIREAYDTLLELTADDKKRMEYEAREKAIRDTQAALSYARKEGEQIGETRGIEIGKARGIEIGKARGIEIGEAQTVRIISLHLTNTPNEEIASICDLPIEVVNRVVDQFEKNRQALRWSAE